MVETDYASTTKTGLIARCELENRIYPERGSKSATREWPHSASRTMRSKFAEKRLRFQQILGVEAFGEPTVDWGEQLNASSRLPWLCHSLARLVEVRSSHIFACWRRAQSSEARKFRWHLRNRP